MKTKPKTEPLTGEEVAWFDNIFLKHIQALRELGAHDTADKRLALRNKVLNIIADHQGE